MSMMMMMMINVVLGLLIMLPRCHSIDAITAGNPVRDGDVLLSGTKNFALGFFSPGKSRMRYVGIWYNKIPELTVVWVANRDDPINDTSGVLAVDGERGLVIYAGVRKLPVWSANVSLLGNDSAPVARLLDVGNLVLFGQSERILWRSFDHPTDSMIPFMTLGRYRRSGSELVLTSWKSVDDPGTGSFTYRIDLNGYPQPFLYKDRVPLWRSGSWTGQRWSGVPDMSRNFLFNNSFVNNEDQVTMTYGILNQSIFFRMAVTESGTMFKATWHDQVRQWVEYWSVPKELCDNYRQCGPNGDCDPSAPNGFICKCLPGFEPKSTRDWFLRDGSGGCVRVGRARICGSGEGFVKLGSAKVPDTSLARVEMSLGLGSCKNECRRNCSCVAYANAEETGGGSGCLMWHGDLADTRTYSRAGQDLYIRVDAITLREYTRNSSGVKSKPVKLAIALGSIAVSFIILLSALLWAKKKKKMKDERDLLASLPMNLAFSDEKEFGESKAASELPFFSLSTIVAATDNFSDHNKLGEGGFGPVYKGVLRDGKEIAVKRLSKHSCQGVEEFKNEVTLIAKLQHRNLVGLVGYCVHGEEKIIVYEYLPNKSLDLFIFDQANRKLLDWEKHLEIIYGIARGLLYLHQDSRLRIVHRDLKASNILIDAAMMPKIADFGMARIFGADQIEVNTNRVVGTYGYMSPEYAIGGRFSTKSDVYSFGVLLLEIVTGKKNTTYSNQNDPDLNLIGHVWELWKEGRSLELVDSFLDEPFAGEALKCIQIGLLCAQDYADDRPNMSTVVSMLGNDSTLPTPKQPAFVFKTRVTAIGCQLVSDEAVSLNDVTCTVVEAR